MSKKEKGYYSSGEVSIFLESIASDIKKARIRRGLSIREMASRVGISPYTYQKLEKDGNVGSAILFSTLWVLGLLDRFKGVISAEKDTLALHKEIREKLAKQTKSKRKPSDQDLKIENLDF